MKSLTIQLVKGPKQEFQSLGWKIPKPGEMRLQFYALNESIKPLVLTMRPAVPSFWLPGYPVVYACEPFPEAVCIEISPCRLLPPPCYQSRKEFERQLPCHYALEPWRAIYWETHRQVSLLEASGDGPLQERLDKWLAAMRKAYEYEACNWRKEIERLRIVPLQELNLAAEDQRAERVKEAEAQLDIIESETRIEGVPCKGRLNLTLADVKGGHEGLRDAWLHEDWARKNGEDLELMSRARRVFRQWLVRHTGTHATIYDMTKRQRCQGIESPHLGEKFESNPQFLEACAKVRYRARFADNADTVVFLADCEPPREELDAAELEEVAKLKGALSNNDAVRIENAAVEIASVASRLEAVPKQLTARTEALTAVVAPLNKLYSETFLADIRKRAVGKRVPELFVDWVMGQFLGSNPQRLPTKGDAFNNCGPGTALGRILEQASYGISKQRLADHLSVMRRLLEQNGLLASRGYGKSRKRESHFQPDGRLEDFNQPTPAESAEDREEERQAAGLHSEEEEDQEQSGDSNERSDGD